MPLFDSVYDPKIALTLKAHDLRRKASNQTHPCYIIHQFKSPISLLGLPTLPFAAPANGRAAAPRRRPLVSFSSCSCPMVLQLQVVEPLGAQAHEHARQLLLGVCVFVSELGRT